MFLFLYFCADIKRREGLQTLSLWQGSAREAASTPTYPASPPSGKRSGWSDWAALYSVTCSEPWSVSSRPAQKCSSGQWAQLAGPALAKGPGGYSLSAWRVEMCSAALLPSIEVGGEKPPGWPWPESLSDISFPLSIRVWSVHQPGSWGIRGRGRQVKGCMYRVSSQTLQKYFIQGITIYPRNSYCLHI